MHSLIVPNYRNDAYHRKPGLSSSMLKTAILRGWRQFEAEYVTGTVQRSETANMRIGSAVHCAVLQPEAYQIEYAVGPCDDRRTKDWKAFAESYVGHAELLTRSEGATVQSMADAVYRRLDYVLTRDERMTESSIWWQDAVLCKCRPDLLLRVSDSETLCIDLKTTKDATPDGFRRECATYGYVYQHIHYARGVEAQFGGTCTFLLCAVQNEPPHICRVYALSPECLQRATEKYEQALREFARRRLVADWSDEAEDEVTELNVFVKE